MLKKIGLFKRQHREILELVGKFEAALEGDNIREYPGHAHALLRKLDQRLIGHLAVEDMELYPQLMSHRNPHVRQITLDFVCTIGRIAQTFESFSKRWSGMDLIVMNHEEFKREAAKVMHALKERIHHENETLFPLLDGGGED